MSTVDLATRTHRPLGTGPDNAPSAERAVERIRLFHARHRALQAGVALVLAGLALTIVTATTMPDPVQQPLDDAWLNLMADHRAAPLTALAGIMSVIGGPLVTVPLRLFIVVWLTGRRQWLRLSSFVAAVLASELCIGPIKSIVERARPVGGLVATHGTSFPSGHAAAGAVTAMGLVIVFTHPGRRRIHWFVAATLFAVAMAMSRTYLGVHWLSDVVAGGCFGVGWALLWPASLEMSRDAFFAWRDGRLRTDGLAANVPATATEPVRDAAPDPDRTPAPAGHGAVHGDH